jgi:hypothetical protein
MRAKLVAAMPFYLGIPENKQFKLHPYEDDGYTVVAQPPGRILFQGHEPSATPTHFNDRRTKKPCPHVRTGPNSSDDHSFPA